MRADFEELMRKLRNGGAMVDDGVFRPKGSSAFLPAVDYDVNGIHVSRDEGMAPELDGGAVAAPPRKPLVAQSTAATVSGDDNDERGRGILAELSQGIDVDERAALNDPRASASAQDARNRSDRMSNIMLQAAGLQPLTKQDDPYVSERDKMRDWVMKRAGKAEGQQRVSIDAKRYFDAQEAAKQSRADAAAKAKADQEREAKKQAREDAKLEADRAQRAKEFEETQRHNRANEGIGWKNANRPRSGMAELELDDDGNIVPKTVQERRQKMKEDALKPRPGWEPIDPSGPTFRDPQQAKRFDDSVAALGAIKNHKSHIMEGLEHLKHAKNPSEADIILGEINAQMGAMASKLRDAEGLNNTDASNHAVETMLSLSGGSIVNLRNMANSGRLPAILNAATNSGEANLNTLAESHNLRRSTPKSAQSGDVVTVRRKSDGVTKVLSKAQAAKVLADPNYEEVK